MHTTCNDMKTLIFDTKPRQAGKTEQELRKALFEVAKLRNVISKASSDITFEILDIENQDSKESLHEISEQLKAAIE